jgi:DNA helicase HerA-like ATPase
MLQSPEFACVFAPGALPSFMTTLNGFLGSDKKILRVSLKYLPSSHNAREIIANIIGRYLLDAAKKGAFQDKPVVVMLDEAHQFLNKSLGDENNKYPLESFELIAKEGRKFSLNICLATQRPRDIPEGVLSQMGTLIVHRLINEKDREVVEKASGDIDKSAAAFLPTLAPGEAVIVGVDFPIPLTVQVSKPQARPDSKGPDYQGKWKIQAQAAAAAVPVPGAPNVQS